MHVCVIVCAAGLSTRFGTNKLDADVHGRSVLQRTVDVFTKHPRIDSIVVAGPYDTFDEFKLRHGDALGLMGCVVCRGGQHHRYETVQAALQHAPSEATHIAVHDAARCCISKSLVDRLLDAIETPIEGGSHRAAVIPGISVTDTLKRVSAKTNDALDEDPLDAILGDAGKADLTSRTVEDAVDREHLVAVQTPQIFESGLLKRAYEQTDLRSTDDSTLVERLGETVHVVEGDPTNIKITTPNDLTLARALHR